MNKFINKYKILIVVLGLFFLSSCYVNVRHENFVCVLNPSIIDGVEYVATIYPTKGKITSELLGPWALGFRAEIDENVKKIRKVLIKKIELHSKDADFFILVENKLANFDLPPYAEWARVKIDKKFKVKYYPEQELTLKAETILLNDKEEEIFHHNVEFKFKPKEHKYKGFINPITDIT